MPAIRLLIVLLAVSSCGTPIYTNASAEYVGTLKVWVADDKVIEVGDIMEGCDAWQPLGVKCVRVAKKADADVFVSVSHMTCWQTAAERVRGIREGWMSWHFKLRPECRPEIPAEGAPIGEEWGMAGLTEGNSITLFPACIANSGHGIIDPFVVRLVATHEFGHAMGLTHVPVRCDDKCAEYALDHAGQKICGPAVMNSPPVRVNGITKHDAAAFRVRTPGRPPF